MLKFLRPLTTGDVWWQDGQIKEEEDCVGRQGLSIGTHLTPPLFWLDNIFRLRKSCLTLFFLKMNG
jgi:hypothetical protein